MSELIAVFHHDGHDSQPFVGIASTQEKAFELCRRHDFDQDWIDAIWMDHVFDEDRNNFEEEIKNAYGAFTSYKRAFFFEKCSLDKLCEVEIGKRMFFSNGEEVKNGE
jgi:hypothetical protein